MRSKLPYFFMVITMISILGCANTPTSLGKIASRANIAATYGNSINYNAVDKYSFAQAEVELAASGGYHKIQVGDFLLGEVFAALEAKSFELARLNSFKSQCNNDGVFLPHFLCVSTYSMQVVQQGKLISIEGTTAPIDIGNSMVKQDALFGFPIVVGDDVFHNKITPVLQALAKDIKEKISAGVQ